MCSSYKIIFLLHKLYKIKFLHHKLSQWFLTFFAYLPLYQNKITRLILNGAYLLKIRN